MGTKLDTVLTFQEQIVLASNNLPRRRIITIGSCYLLIIAGSWWVRIFLGI